jgi:Protein of unknown function (DUF2950)
MMPEHMTANRSSFRNKVIPLVLLLELSLVSAPAATMQSPSDQQTTAGAQSTLQAFDTPQQAATALIEATERYDLQSLLKMFGPGGRNLVYSGDTVRDKNNAAAFAANARTKHSIEIADSNPDRAILVVGETEWPFPIPIVKRNAKWYFDPKAGKVEILDRRIGTNELDAIQVCRGYVEAQREYAARIHDGFGVNQYAQKIFSTPGRQDGLYWKNPDGSPGGPIGEAIARAINEGYSVEDRSGYHGYYFKVLKGQGPAAKPLGRLDYVIEGAMIGGFALVAAPVTYRVSGVKTFIVSDQNVVYQKDLGPDTLKIFKDMELYNPDETWRPTNDEWPSSNLPDVTATDETSFPH